MRYQNVETIIFTDTDGNKFPIKDIRPISTFSTGDKLKVQADMQIDEVISRREYYGDGSENLSFAIVDHNIVKFVENCFDLSKIKELLIPVIEEI